MSRKARADSKLKSLPENIQRDIYELLRKNTLEAALPIVREKFDVRTSVTALSQFFSWYPFSRPLEKAAIFAEQLVQRMAEDPKLEINAEKASAAMQIAFEAQALEQQNAEQFVSLRMRRQKDVELSLRKENQDLRLRQYEEKIQAARAALERAKSKGGVSKEALELIEQQLKLL